MFEKFCVKNGAPTLFRTLLEMQTPLREDKREEGTKKTEQAKRHVVSIIYTSAYSQLERCNWLQRDISHLAHYHGLSDVGMSALHKLGMGIGMPTFYRDIHVNHLNHKKNIMSVV